MESFPPLPPLAEVPELVEGGHLWIQELVDGAPFRFAVAADGTLTVGDDERVYGEDVPPSLRTARRHVRESLDWGRLYDEAEDVTAVTFFGVAPRYETVDYDWPRIPPFLGTDVWSSAKADFLPPDVVERVYRDLGLEPVNAVEKEVPGRHFDPDAYELPDSAWYDGPAKGVVVRTKRGDRAVMTADRGDATPGDADRDDAEPPSAPTDLDPGAVVERYVTDDRLERAREVAGAGTGGADVESINEVLLELVAREAYRELERAGVDLDTRPVRRATVRRVQEWLGG